MPFRCYPMNHLRDGGFRGGCFLHLLQPGVKKTHIFTRANGKKRRPNKCLPSPPRSLSPVLVVGHGQNRGVPIRWLPTRKKEESLCYTSPGNQTKRRTLASKNPQGKIYNTSSKVRFRANHFFWIQNNLLKKKCLTSKRGVLLMHQDWILLFTCLLLLATPDQQHHLWWNKHNRI